MACSEAVLYMAEVKSERPYIGAPLVVGPIVYFTALNGFSRVRISRGRAGMIVSSAMWGWAWGFLGSVTVGSENFRSSTAASLVGSGLGMAIATGLTRDSNITGKRVSLINLGGLMGSSFGLGLPYLFNARNTNAYLGSMLLGGIVGMGYAVQATKKFDEMASSYGVNPSGSLVDVGGGRVRWAVPLPQVSWVASAHPLSLKHPRGSPAATLSPQWNVKLVEWTIR
jgi:hypothetical protein